MRGETVVVKRRMRSGTGPGNTPIYEDVETPVDNVLIAPGARQDVVDSNRPDGTEVAWNLSFPKTFTGSLRNAKISVYGEDFEVIGDPRPYPNHLTPTAWNLPVEVRRTDG